MSAYYPHKPIANIESLAKALDIAEVELMEIAKNSDSQFFVAKRVEKELSRREQEQVDTLPI